MLYRCIYYIQYKKQQHIIYSSFPHLLRGWLAASHSSFPHFSLLHWSFHFDSHSLLSLSTTWIHIILSLPLASPHTFHFIQHAFLCPVAIISFHNTCPSHLKRFPFTTSDTDSIPILFLSSDMFSAKKRHQNYFLVPTDCSNICIHLSCRHYGTMVSFFIVVSLLNNIAPNFHIPMPLHKIFRSVSSSFCTTIICKNISDLILQLQYWQWIDANN